MEDAIAALQRLKDYGAFSTKSYNQPSRASRQRILNAARELGMLVVPEGGMVFHWNTNQVIDGHTTVEHNLPVERLYEDLLQLWVASGTMTIPTHVVSYGDLNGEQEWYQKTEVYALDKIKNFHPERDVQAASIRRTAAPDEEYSHRDASLTVAKIIQAGGLGCVGAHGQRQGIAFHWELWMFHQGLSEVYDADEANYQSLRAATRYCAEGLGLDELGWLKPGMIADVAAFLPSNDPLSDIYESQNVKYIVKDGKMYDTSTLAQVAPEEVPLPSGPRLEARVVGCEDDTRVGATFMGACVNPPAPAPSDSSGGGLSNSEAIGLGFGVTAGVILMGAAIFLVMKSKTVVASSEETDMAQPMLKDV